MQAASTSSSLRRGRISAYTARAEVLGQLSPSSSPAQGECVVPLNSIPPETQILNSTVQSSTQIQDSAAESSTQIQDSAAQSSNQIQGSAAKSSTRIQASPHKQSGDKSGGAPPPSGSPFRISLPTPKKPSDSDTDEYWDTYAGHVMISRPGEESFSLAGHHKDMNAFHSAILTPRRDNDGIIYIPKDLVTPPKFGANSTLAPVGTRRSTITSTVTASANSGTHTHTPRQDGHASTVTASTVTTSANTPQRDAAGSGTPRRQESGGSSVGTPRRQESGGSSVGTPRTPRLHEVEPGRIIVENGPERLDIRHTYICLCVYICVHVCVSVHV
jgi:hypothetical protein